MTSFFAKRCLRAAAISLSFIAFVGGSLTGCPTEVEEGQSDYCAVMMNCWYDFDSYVRDPSEIPIRLGGEALTDADIDFVREHFGQDGACWQDQELAPACIDACVQTLASDCALAQPQCSLPADGSFVDDVAVGAVTSCEDAMIVNATEPS